MGQEWCGRTWSPSELWSEKRLVRTWRPSDFRVVPQGMNCGQPLGSIGRGGGGVDISHPYLTWLSLPVVIHLSQSASVVVHLIIPHRARCGSSPLEKQAHMHASIHIIFPTPAPSKTCKQWLRALTLAKPMSVLTGFMRRLKTTR